jgi:hypothetical protein
MDGSTLCNQNALQGDLARAIGSTRALQDKVMPEGRFELPRVYTQGILSPLFTTL